MVRERQRGVSMKSEIGRYGRWTGVLAALAVALLLFACGDAQTSTPTIPPTPSLASTVAPMPSPTVADSLTPTPIAPPASSPTSAPVSTAQIDDDTTWQELFDGFTPAEQTCIRTEVGGELESVLGERVMTDDDLQDWQVSLFECLNPEAARSVFTSLLVAGMVSDETYDVTERDIQCVSAWVAGADVHRVIRGMSEDDLAVLGEVMSGVIPCLADFFMPDLLAGMDIDADALTDDERTCLNEWMVGHDWSNFMTAVMEEDLGIIGEFMPGLIRCAPGSFLALFLEDFGVDLDTLTDEETECLEGWLTDLDWSNLMTAMTEDDLGIIGELVPGLMGCAPGLFLPLFLEDFGVDLDTLTDEETECLEGWLTDFDWDAVIAATTAAASTEDYEGLLGEAFGLLACIPDLALDENVDSGGPDDHAADLWLREIHEGVIGTADDVDMFELAANAGQFYQIDVALGTLDDSVLTVYDAFGSEVAYNDDYGSGTASRIVWSAPSSDVYYVEVSGFFSTGSYTLTIETIDVTDDYPNSPDLSLPSITPGESINGAIDYGDDVDLFEMEADADQSYRIDVALGTLDDSVLTVYDADGWDVAYNDDYGSWDRLAHRLERPLLRCLLCPGIGVFLHGLLYADRRAHRRHRRLPQLPRPLSAVHYTGGIHRGGHRLRERRGRVRANGGCRPVLPDRRCPGLPGRLRAHRLRRRRLGGRIQ